MVFILETLVEKAKNGDRKSLMVIIEKYKFLIIKLASTYHIPSYEFEDLVQQGYLSVIKAVKIYLRFSCSYIHCYRKISKIRVPRILVSLFLYTLKDNNKYNLFMAMILVVVLYVLTYFCLTCLGWAYKLVISRDTKIYYSFFLVNYSFFLVKVKSIIPFS
ncbi:helix-turn-helix domain-containing protein [Clostridium estertheticum]|uniref:helix-turn-helix domain-containing protein n=1 Tax=Clostridium estertheticum TaxID=238834 RepID=UPI001CF31D5E|nr:helix-turn-helix domain-containing protein [Clostridium estertheticum]MCB2357017.1 helix-turn-helix domain-containing protein [Clostridium estertheticum]WAG43904.1 helix-turn-helix domain-containing protein [Clostridium estertheticum]